MKPADEDLSVVVPHNRQRREHVRTCQHRSLEYDLAVLENIQPLWNHGVPGRILRIEQFSFLFASPVMARPQNFERWVAELLPSVNAIRFLPCNVGKAFITRYWVTFLIQRMSLEG